MRKLRISYALLLIALLLSFCALVACGGDNGGGNTENEQVEIIFVTDDGMEIARTILNKGDTVRYPNPPSIYGKVFDGWDKLVTNATESTTIVAIYVPNSQGGNTGGDNTGGDRPGGGNTGGDNTGGDRPGGGNIGGNDQKLLVRFFSENGEEIFSEYVLKGGSPSFVPQAPQIDGMVFIGWSEDYSSVQENLDIYPIYKELVSYQVRFFDYDGRWMETKTVYENESVSPPFVNRTGYDLVGWSEDLTSVSSNLDVYPIYQLCTVSNAFDISNKLNTDGTCTLTFSVKGNVCFAGAQGTITVPGNFLVEGVDEKNEGCATRLEGNALSFVFTSVSGENITQETELFTLTVRCTDNSYFSRLGVNISMVFDQDFNNIGFGAVLGSTFYASIEPKE